jgi:periplasmic divalent cation tolerance protein
MDSPTVYVVSTTVDSQEGAQALAHSAVSARLAACAQVSAPVLSVYWWQAAVETTTEWLVTFKTTDEGYPALERHLRAAHPYHVPEIIATPAVAGHTPYLQWVRDETRPAQ